MKIVQIIKKLNNTELGKGGTHECYVHIPKELNINDFFEKEEEVKNFIYKKNGKKYQIRCTIGREKRIVGLGDFYRDYKMSAGDEIILERYIEENGKSRYSINFNKRKDILMIQKCKDGFEILNEEMIDVIATDSNVYYAGEIKKMTIEYINAVKKRADSPRKTDIYDIKVDGISLANQYKSKDMVEIQFDNNQNRAYINNICTWRKYIFDMED